VNADNATSNDTQMAALEDMDNTFEDMSRARCFNHTLQLSAKALLRPFNVGMSSTNPVLEKDETNDLDKEMWTLLDKDAIGDDETDDGGDDDQYGYSDDREDLDGSNKADDTDSDDTDENEMEDILSDTAVVRRTVTKVRSDLFWL
jgi:hypothetical protein